MASPRPIVGEQLPTAVIASIPAVRPDFSGLWQLSVDKSTFRGPAPKDILVTIQHREPTLIQTMVIVAVDGGEQQQTFTFDTTGGASPNVVGGREVQIRAQWSDSELVIESVLSTPNGTFEFKDHWSLSADGQTLRMAHIDDPLAGQVAVLERAAPEHASSFNANRDA